MQYEIQRTARTAHVSMLITVYNTAQNSSDNLPSYLQATIIAEMLSIGGKGTGIKLRNIQNINFFSYTLETFTGMGTVGITWNAWESHRDGCKCCGIPVGMETDAAGLPRGCKNSMVFPHNYTLLLRHTPAPICESDTVLSNART